MPRVSGVQEAQRWGSPGGPVVKTLCFHFKGVQVRSLVRELRSHMLCGAAKGEKKRKQNKKSARDAAPA